MQPTSGVAEPAAQLAHADRRALSQAWYSALHVAERTQAASRTAVTPYNAKAERPVMNSARSTAPRRPSSDSAAPALGARRDSRRSFARPTLGMAFGERRMPRPLLVFNFGRTMTPDEPRIAQSVERAVAHTVTSPVSQTFQLRAGREDVRLLVRGDATGLRLVAVCAAAARERVERALAQARFVLAARGVRLETV